jgi:hypothetical protein
MNIHRLVYDFKCLLFINEVIILIVIIHEAVLSPPEISKYSNQEWQEDTPKIMIMCFIMFLGIVLYFFNLERILDQYNNFVVNETEKPIKHANTYTLYKNEHLFYRTIIRKICNLILLATGALYNYVIVYFTVQYSFKNVVICTVTLGLGQSLMTIIILKKLSNKNEELLSTPILANIESDDSTEIASNPKLAIRDLMRGGAIFTTCNTIACIIILYFALKRVYIT